MRNDRRPFLGIQVNWIQAPRFRARRGPFCQGFVGPICPRPPCLVKSVPPLAVSGKVWYTRAVSKLDKGLLLFCFVVPKWCPTLQNYAVTAYAALFAGFEKTPISCGFAPSAYETICRLITANSAIQAIKNSKYSVVIKYFFQSGKPINLAFLPCAT